ncbi:MAG TPA: hypothetical protein VGX25_21900, partial [Actinophytocola sp.]|uniref:hypothetical protein n=1 Tax=Actinophytocola sp. TaxID=1872138 RepID=UPI002DDDAAB4
VMPAAWAALVVFLVKQFGLPPAAEAWLSSAPVVDAVTNLAALAAVYAFVRWIEPRIPDWATRLLLGSARPPTYTQ